MKPRTRSIASWFTDKSKSQPKCRSSTSLTVEQLEGREMLSASPIAFKPDSRLYDSNAVNGTLFFSTSGGELWKTNGSVTGTVLVKDLDPTGSTKEAPFGMTDFDGQLYFLFDDLSNHREALWKSDGTDAGTILLKDIGPVFDPLDGGFGRVESVSEIANGNLLLFTRWQDVDGDHWQLWKTDGTTTGTSLAKDFGPEVYLAGFTNLNGAILFYSNPNRSPTQTLLWRTDGTGEGTFVLQQLPGTPADGFWKVNGTLFFETDDLQYPFDSNRELWITDGTSVGTLLVKTFGPRDELRSFFDLDGAFYFLRTTEPLFNTNDAIPSELWKSDGTADGTVLIKAFAGKLNSPTHFHGEVFFMEDQTLHANGAYLNETTLYETDGTSDGTVDVKHFVSKFSFGIPDDYLTADNNILFIVASDGADSGLWSSNGTDDGTIFLKQGSPVYYNPSPLTWASISVPPFEDFEFVGGTIYFKVNGQMDQLWQTDGTKDGTKIVAQFNWSSGYEDEEVHPVFANGNLFFLHFTFQDDRYLWPEVWTLVPDNAPPPDPIDLYVLDPKPVVDPGYLFPRSWLNSEEGGIVQNLHASSGSARLTATHALDLSTSFSASPLSNHIDISDNRSDLTSVQTSLILTNKPSLSGEAKVNGEPAQANLDQKAESRGTSRVDAQSEKIINPLTIQTGGGLVYDDEPTSADLDAFFTLETPGREAQFARDD
jgi:ELWxxDGT repeat protein